MPGRKRASARDEIAASGKRPYQVEALAKGLRVLGLFSERRPALSLSEIAAETGIPMPTAFRMAATLVTEGFLEQLADGGYRPAAKVLTLGFAALRGLDPVQLADGPLHRLAGELDQTVNLGTLSDDQVLYLIRIRNNDLISANIQVGSRLPAVHSSIGKMLLSDLNGTELDRLLTETSFLGQAGPNAFRTREELDVALAEIRNRGWAMQDEEFAYGLRSVAAPIRDASGKVVAAANVAVPAREFPTRRLRQELLPRLLATCAEISVLLGSR
ncbi:IclR family transcriptional regulator [Nocardia sp. NPDC127526]|uniref:IclR family transcriptional regulator n=1 Tax=Nocardia sp. NPDC127526 TaxID=3345393 RepID=UPI0036406696